MGKKRRPDPEERARENIDRLLELAGWKIQDRDEVNLTAGRGVAIRQFPLELGHGEADYLLYVDQKAVGVVEAKPEGTTLTGVEVQSAKYAEGLPPDLPAIHRPLPFCYESTGVETRFTNGLDPDPRSRRVFSFHRPETLAEWSALLASGVMRRPAMVAADRANLDRLTLRTRLRMMPALVGGTLWDVQARAIQNLEKSLAENRPRALIQMATGSGKTYMAANAVYRLVKFGGARRILFLVDRANLGRQTLREFQQFVTPDDGRKFTELYNVQHLRSNRIDPVAKVCIATIQRVYSMLAGRDLDPTLEEASGFLDLHDTPAPISYNTEVPIETFDIIVTDECHRSIYNLWRQVLEYFDAFLVGLTATPSKQTFGFFEQNLIMEYPHAQAVADGVNVDFDVYRIRTEISERGSKVDAGYWVDKRDRASRRVRWEQLDEDLQYAPAQLDREIVAKDQLRTLVQTFRDKFLKEVFPERKYVPKTLIYAKDDSHADDIVAIVREEFAKGNEFAQKITYKTTGVDPEDLIAQFRNSFNPRIAVTVDMIATGTDIRPLEVVFFLRPVRSRVFFEQMKGRGVRVITPEELAGVTPDAKAKTRFVLIDAVGVCETELMDTKPLDRQPSVGFDKLLERIAFGNRQPEALESLAGRLARLDRKIDLEARKEIEDLAGQPLKQIVRDLVRATDPDEQLAAAREATGRATPTQEDVARVARELAEAAVKPIVSNPKLRNHLSLLQTRSEQVIDDVSKDQVIEAGLSPDARARAASTVESFRAFLRDNREEITVLQVLYSRPYRDRLSLSAVKELAKALQDRANLRPDSVWRAFKTVEPSKVHGAFRSAEGSDGPIANLVSLVRFALGQDAELVPFPEAVRERFARWIAGREKGGNRFSPEQRQWLEAMRDHIAASLRLEMDDFELTPFDCRGGLARVHQVFGADLPSLVAELNEALVA